MALLPYVDEKTAPQAVREMLERSTIKLNVGRMVANSEAAMRPFSQLGNSLMTRAKLNPKLREIAILRNAKVCGSVYEWTQHVPIAKWVGVTEQQVAAMDNWEPAKCFTDLERLVLKFTDEVARNVNGRNAIRDLKA